MSTSETLENNVVLKSLIEIDQSINYRYRTSKSPNFIKDYKVKRSRKKLEKAIKNYAGMKTLDRSELLYYITQVNDLYGGNFEHLHKVEHQRDTILAAFVIPVEDTKCSISALISMNNKYDDDDFIIRYALFNEACLVTLRFSFEFKKFAFNTNKHKEYKFPWKSGDENKCIIDLVTETIINDINTFLNKMIERSERISNDEL